MSINDSSKIFYQFSGYAVIALIISNLYLNFTAIPGNFLSWDIMGYYFYLPLLFIYNDIQISDYSVLQNIVETYKGTTSLYQIHRFPNGNHGIIYTMGMAVLYLPFFIIGHIIALLSVHPADGFSKPYQYAVWVGCIVYSIIGIILLRKILLQYFTDKIVALTLLIIFFATNYYHHTTYIGHNGMTHNQLFTTYTVIIYFTILWHKTQKTKHLVFLAIACGLTILSRPSEIVCLAIPLLWLGNSYNSLREKFIALRKNKKPVYLFAITVFLVCSLQMVYWFYASGKPIYVALAKRGGVGFDFLNPHTFDYLFSFRKGWLIYTPVMLFSLIGFYYLQKQHKKLFAPFLIYFIANLYVVSSWSCWWYAASFSQRSIIQAYVVLAFPLAAFLTFAFKKNYWIRIAVTVSIILFTALNQFQIFQLRKGILHNANMTKEYYMAIFGKTKVDDLTKNLLLIERWSVGQDDPDLKYYEKRTIQIENFDGTDNLKSTLNSANIDKGNFVLLPDQKGQLIFEEPYKQITEKDHFWLHLRANVYIEDSLEINKTMLMVAMYHGKRSYKKRVINLKDLNVAPNQWTKIEYYYLTPEIRVPKDRLIIKFINKGNDNVLLDDFKLDIYEKQNHLIPL